MQPQSLTILGTFTATFSLTPPAKRPIFYQWFYGSSGILNGTNPVLTLPNVTVSQSGQYRCLVQNNGGATFSQHRDLDGHATSEHYPSNQPTHSFVSHRTLPPRPIVASPSASLPIRPIHPSPTSGESMARTSRRARWTSIGINSNTLIVTNVVQPGWRYFLRRHRTATAPFTPPTPCSAFLPFMLSGSQPMTGQRARIST